MNGVMIIGHGNFGSGLNSTLELIAGKQDFVKYADFTVEKSPEDFKNESKHNLDSFKDKDKIYIKKICRKLSDRFSVLCYLLLEINSVISSFV